jgi:hypothetical protein
VNEVTTTRAIRAQRRRRWPWALTLLLGLVGVAGAVVRGRLASAQPDQVSIQPAEHETWRYRDAVAAGRAPTGNGVVRAHHRRQ